MEKFDDFKFGKELLEKLRRQLELTDKEKDEREERISNCEVDPSDCFLSEWANDMTRRELIAKIEILENKGLSKFDVLCDLNGNVLANKLIRTRFGRAYKLDSGQWVSANLKKKTLKARGLKIAKRKMPAWAVLKSEGRGLSGHCWVEVFQSHTNYWTGEKVKKQ